MIRFIVSTFSEAKPIIDIFNLKKNHNYKKFSVFDSDKISLTISKIGKVNSALAVAFTFYKICKNKNDIWINFGLCGHKSHEIGSIFLVNKILDNSNNKVFFPFITNFKINSLSCTTLEKKGINYKDSLFEMESSGFFQAATKFSSKELIFILKIVSDNELKSINFQNADEIYNIIIKKESLLKNFCDHLLNLNKMTLHKNQNIYKEEIERVFNKINLTFTEKQQMKTLLKLYFLKNSKLKFDLLNESKSGSYNIKQLRKYLSL
tara:strand:- start:68 stop:859 length:792 start_codon:yes stop_codon:yes gene_type:complete